MPCPKLTFEKLPYVAVIFTCCICIYSEKNLCGWTPKNVIVYVNREHVNGEDRLAGPAENGGFCTMFLEGFFGVVLVCIVVVGGGVRGQGKLACAVR